MAGIAGNTGVGGWTAAAVAVAAAALAPWPAHAEEVVDGCDWAMRGMHGWGAGWAGMVGVPLAFVIGLAALAAGWAIGRRAGGAPNALATPTPTPTPVPAPTPLDILKERFARGEIDGEEFESRRRVLGVG